MTRKFNNSNWLLAIKSFYKNNLDFSTLYFYDRSDYKKMYKDYSHTSFSNLFRRKELIHLFNNTWLYTTNHRRIAMKYFTFIIVSGLLGTFLASLIRSEMAYPGAGILYGDSIQYLTIVTGHGVIMVFYMIIPLLFGGFSNLLLPLQLGVRDVASPRLNSSSFWFLPGGLIMLGHLICTEKKYQKLNCFNIIEAQALLKQKFFFDLISENEKNILPFSTFFSLSLPNSVLFNKQRLLETYLINIGNRISTFYLFSKNQSFVFKESLFESFLFLSYQNYISNFINFFSNNGFLSKLTFRINFLPFKFNNILDINFSLYKYIISYNFNISCLNLFNFSFIKGIYDFFSLYPRSDKFSNNYVQDNFSSKIFNIKMNKNLNLVKSNNFLRFFNTNYLYTKYDYKNGNYMPESNFEKFPFLLISKYNLNTNKRFNSWFFIEDFNNKFNPFNFKNSFNNPNTYLNNSFKLFQNDIFNFILFKNFSNSINNKFIFIDNLNKKFNKLFLTSTFQQRIYNNWREIKFSRESWRSKMLVSRHQKTLYNRYVNENNVFYVLEKNAKDLLPGWAMITPFSSRIRYTSVGKVDVGLCAVLLSLNASIVSSANFLLTYRYLSTLNNRKMRDARSFFSECIIVSSWMIIAANPMLILGIIMLLSDRHLKTSFFDYSGGGDTILFQHMFWFFGHPEVYIVIIPVFGFVNTILSAHLKKRISARTSLIYSLYTIAFLGFFVWGHHMYMVGLAHTTRMLFSTLTVMISVPAATKLMHWSVTLINSSFQIQLPLLFILIFMFLFVSGGISGMCVAHTGMDILFHDTLYVIGHFHIMFAGAAMFGSWGAFYYYYRTITGFKFNRLFAYFHLLYYLIGHLMTFIPLFWLGYAGMPRRILDYPAVFGGWHAIASSGHILAVFGVVSFIIMAFEGIRQKKAGKRISGGVGRFNTRANFFIYAANRNRRKKNKYFLFSPVHQKINNYEVEELTLYTYSISNK